MTMGQDEKREEVARLQVVIGGHGDSGMEERGNTGDVVGWDRVRMKRRGEMMLLALTRCRY